MYQYFPTLTPDLPTTAVALETSPDYLAFKARYENDNNVDTKEPAPNQSAASQVALLVEDTFRKFGKEKSAKKKKKNKAKNKNKDAASTSTASTPTQSKKKNDDRKVSWPARLQSSIAAVDRTVGRSGDIDASSDRTMEQRRADKLYGAPANYRLPNALRARTPSRRQQNWLRAYDAELAQLVGTGVELSHAQLALYWARGDVQRAAQALQFFDETVDLSEIPSKT